MKLIRLPSYLRLLAPLVLGLLGLSATLPLQAQSKDVLTGKTLTLRITNGAAPFVTTGTQTLTLDTPTAGNYTLDTGTTRTAAGSYTYAASGIGANLTLNSYFGSGGPASLELYNYNAAAGTGGFETYATGSTSNSGTYTIGSGGGGDGGTTTVPVITGSTQLTATAGQAFSYQIATSPAATAFDNQGGNAPIAISPVTGLVTGTFTAAGTFTFSVRGANAAGNGATVVFTVVVSPASGPTGTITNDNLIPANLVGRRLAFTITSPTNTLLDGPNNYVVSIETAALLQRTAQGFTWNQTSYTAETATGDGGARLTTLRAAGTWSNSSTGYAVFITLSQLNGIGRFTVRDANDANRANSGTFTLGGNTTIVAAPDISALAGTYSGQQFSGVPGPAAVNPFGDFVATVTAGGVLSAQGGTITGRVDASGNVTFDASGSNLAFGYTTGRIEGNRLVATGQISQSGRLLVTYRIDAPRTTGATVIGAPTAPANLTGYRNRVGQTFEFTVTGATSGTVWGSEVYTDDSPVALAAVHAGLVVAGQTKVVAVTILPSQTAFAVSTRNGVTSASRGNWSGSYSFAGAGVVSGSSLATTKPATPAGLNVVARTLSAGGRLVLPVAVRCRDWRWRRRAGGNYTYQWFLNGLALLVTLPAELEIRTL